MNDAQTHLWEVDHPYYMSEGNYYQAGCHQSYQTLDNFLSDWRDTDLDLNFVVRWDWLEGEDWGAGAFNGDPYYRNGRLMVQFVGQRKASLWSCEVSVCRADEPRVIEFLTPRAAYIRRLWEPLLGSTPTTPTEETPHDPAD